MSERVPEGWEIRTSEDIYVRLKVPKVYDRNMVEKTGLYPVLDQSTSGKIGFLKSDPDFVCDIHKPIVTFANHTCAVRKMTVPFGVIQNVFPLTSRSDTDIEFIFQILNGGVEQEGYKGHYPKLRETDFLLPPLPEQKKIASILTSVDEVIETTQKQIDKLQDLKKATMNEFLTKGIGHTEFKDSELGRIPKSWEVVRFGDIAKQKTLGTTERGGEYAMVPLVKMGDIQSGKVLLGSNEKVSQSKLTPQNFLSNGDFLFNTRNTPELVGKVGNFNSSKVASFDNNLLRISFFEDVSPLFMGIQFNDASFKKRLKTLVAGTTSVAAIYWNDLSRFRVVKPKIMEQTEIASIIYSINMQIDDQGKKLAQTQSLKKSLMQDLLTGKVRVQVN